jgi:hypothetical protein
MRESPLPTTDKSTATNYIDFGIAEHLQRCGDSAALFLLAGGGATCPRHVASIIYEVNRSNDRIFRQPVNWKVLAF